MRRLYILLTIAVLLIIAGTAWYIHRAHAPQSEQVNQELGIAPTSPTSSQDGSPDIAGEAALVAHTETENESESDGPHLGTIKRVYKQNGQWYLDVDYLTQLPRESSDPNGGKIINQNPRIRTLQVSPDVKVQMQTLSTGADGNFNVNQSISFDLFTQLMNSIPPKGNQQYRSVPYVVTLNNSLVVNIQEQYQP